MKVTFFFRPKMRGVHSIETLFGNLFNQFPRDIEKEVYICTHKWKRFHSYLKARKYQGEVNHITGDIHQIALFLNRGKTILTIHDIGRWERDLKGWKKRLFKLLWLDLPLRSATIVTTISEFTKSKLVQECGIAADKIRVIHNPATIDFNYAPGAFNAESPTILQIGSGAQKNLNRLIEAVKGTPFRLLLIRRPDAAIEFKLQSLNIPYEWHSNLSRQEVYECYKKCDLIFFASEYEGFGVPILEANAVGRPVVTSNLASMPEVAGKSAILVNPYDVQEIRDALFKLKEKEQYRVQLIQEGIENLKRFSPEKTAQAYYELYQEIKQTN
ncbi:glycosyltransferase family 4 protein [Mangrovibacterium diazotrophicum]|uniref:Glycosyltransferase involved in cell wall biosynthesis n=1 Tax=Mangrovibacterium diazotrophicum TaxID=1261403 RepID=A0A419VX06_9BACT|nr:glycosyltransferase family 1 protein [Mangrovibacterium diazotrophicum]RKD87719.1 glycosyltransferase involved in cell wall biosynthesis [Mangrovibacterium diazotrophicum]